MASEVGSGQVPIFPTFKGFRRGVTKEIEGAEREGSAKFRKGFAKSSATAGQDAGKGFRKGFTASTSNLGKQMQADVAKAARAVSASRLKEQDAAGKVRVAEAQLAEARKKHAADSSQVIRAEERLATTQRTLSAAQDVTKASTDQLTTAQKRLADTGAKSTSGLRSGFSKLGGVASQVGGVISGAFSTAMAGVKRVVSDAAEFVQSSFKVAGAAVAAVLGVALAKGFGRLEAIDTARTKLKALGNSAVDVEKIMGSALDAVKGTAFGLGDAAGAAGALVAAKVPLDVVDRALKSVSSTAAVAGSDFGEMGDIFAKVAAQQKLDGATVQQLQKRQVAILPMIADYYKVTGEEAKNMVSEGKVSFEDFVAITGQLGDAAQIMGTSFKGMAQNVGAALGRMGAVILGPAFEGLKAVMPGVMSVIDQVTNAITPVFETLGQKVAPVMERIADALSGWKLDPSGFSGLAGILAVLAPVIGAVAGSLMAMLGPLARFVPILGGLTAPLGIAIGLFTALFAINPDTLMSGFNSIGPMLEGMLDGILSGLTSFIHKVVPTLIENFAANAPMLVTGVVDIILGLVDAIVGALPGLLGAVVGIIPQLISAILGMLPQMMNAGLRLFTGLVEGVVVAVPMIVNSLVTLLPQVVDAIVSMLPRLIQSGISLFLGLATALVTAIPQIVTALIGALPQILTAIVEAIPLILEAGIQLFMGLIGAITTVLPQLIVALTEMLPAIITALVEMIPTLLLAAVDLFIQLVQAIPVVLPQLITSIVGMLPTIITALIGMIPQLMTGAVELFMGIVEALPEMIPALVEALVGLGPAMVDAIVGIIPQLFDAGKALIQGLIDGVGDMFGAVGDAFGGVMDFVGGFFPHSPAKRGPFSGAGWRKVADGGASLVEQFADGAKAAQSAFSFEVAASGVRNASRGVTTASGATAGLAAAPAAAGPGVAQTNYFDKTDPREGAELANQMLAAALRGA